MRTRRGKISATLDAAVVYLKTLMPPMVGVGMGQLNEGD